VEDLTTMFGNDELECTYLHLHSLRHFGNMVERMPSRQADDALGDQETPKQGKRGSAGRAPSNGAVAEEATH
jgi:hypothetical protein